MENSNSGRYIVTDKEVSEQLCDKTFTNLTNFIESTRHHRVVLKINVMKILAPILEKYKNLL